MSTKPQYSCSGFHSIVFVLRFRYCTRSVWIFNAYVYMCVNMQFIKIVLQNDIHTLRDIFLTLLYNYTYLHAYTVTTPISIHMYSKRRTNEATNKS